MDDRCSAADERLARLQALGRPVKVALVGCGVRKRLDRQPARHLYSGNLFRAALEHAERTADEAWILSALHHLLDLDEEIDPYNLSLKAYRKREREIWGDRVAVALSSKYGRLEVQLIAYAGREYIDPL